MRMILSETINLFISGGSVDLEDRMQRACLCDLDKLRDSIITEINALPPKKKELIKSTIKAYLADLLDETKISSFVWR